MLKAYYVLCYKTEVQKDAGIVSISVSKIHLLLKIAMSLSVLTIGKLKPKW